MKTEMGDRIVGVSAIPGRNEVVLVRFSERDPLTVPIPDWVELGLKVGDDADPAQIEHLQVTSERGQAMWWLLRYISYRQRSAKEVLQHLRDRDVSVQTAVWVAEQAAQQGWIGDEKLIAAVYQSRKSQDSRVRMEQRLRARGVSARDIRQQLDSVDAQDQEAETAKAAAVKFLKKLDGTDPSCFLKTASHLQRKGFPESLIRTVLRFLDNDCH